VSTPNRRCSLALLIYPRSSSSVPPLFVWLGYRLPSQLSTNLLSGLAEGHDHTHTGGYGSVEHTIQLGEGELIPPHRGALKRIRVWCRRLAPSCAIDAADLLL